MYDFPPLMPPSPTQIRKAQEIYQELQDMDNQLKIWEMIIDFLASGDFLLIILTVAIGIAIVKSMKVIDRYLNGSHDNSTKD